MDVSNRKYISLLNKDKRRCHVLQTQIFMISEGLEAYTFIYYYTCLHTEGIHYEPYSRIACQVLTGNNGIKIRKSFK